MFGIGMTEMLLILAIALIVVGPKKLPELAKSLGRAFGEFRRATSELKESFEQDTGLRDIKNSFRNGAKDDPSNLVLNIPERIENPLDSITEDRTRTPAETHSLESSKEKGSSHE